MWLIITVKLGKHKFLLHLSDLFWCPVTTWHKARQMKIESRCDACGVKNCLHLLVPDIKFMLSGMSYYMTIIWTFQFSEEEEDETMETEEPDNDVGLEALMDTEKEPEKKVNTIVPF